ncbi:MAG TPA: HAMP domain-containing sensor histidine kinase [Streptosporangiaceae bacterium]|nr:HAMP domain-containing sensor histidine kinase [Streptosporangiaceae bacterium]
MRRRLLFSTLAVAVTAVVLFGLPLAFVLIRLQTNAAHQLVQRDATTVARTLQNRLRSGLPPDPTDAADAAHSLPDRYVSISRDGGPPVTFGHLPGPNDNITAKAVTKNFKVTVVADDSVATEGVTEALIVTTTLAVLAVGVAVALAMFQARRLSRPLQDLAGAADRLGSGDARPLGRRYGVAELDRVAEGLDESAQRIADMLTAEREFAADASHQLRTPLTALSMRLEEMLAAADQPTVVREEGAAALVQTERLADVVSQLLGRTRSPAGGSRKRVSIDDVVAQQVVEWDPAFRRKNRKLEIAGDKNLRAYGRPGTLSQVIATLLDNALVHGAGTVAIRTSRTPKSVVIEVRDEGKGVPADLVPRIFERNVSGKPGGTGLGLALARSIAAADGGNVVLVRPTPAVFAVFLPRQRPGGAGQPPVVSGPA